MCSKRSNVCPSEPLPTRGHYARGCIVLPQNSDVEARRSLWDVRSIRIDLGWFLNANSVVGTILGANEVIILTFSTVLDAASQALLRSVDGLSTRGQQWRPLGWNERQH